MAKRPKTSKLSCEECHDEFDAANPRAKYCSPACRNRAARRRRVDAAEVGEWDVPDPPEQKPASYLLSCDQCGTEFEAKRPHAKYCSTACRNRAARQRRADEEAEVAAAAAAGVGEVSVGEIERYTRDELERVARLDSALGRSALALARRLDRVDVGSIDESGSSFASVARAHRTTLHAVMLEAAPTQEDEVSRRRRERDERRAEIARES